jgi:hypothetical protein
MRIARVTAVRPIGGWTSRRILVDRTSPRCPQPGQESVAVGDQAQHGQMPTSVVLPDRGESEVGQTRVWCRGRAG